MSQRCLSTGSFCLVIVRQRQPLALNISQPRLEKRFEWSNVAASLYTH